VLPPAFASSDFRETIGADACLQRRTTLAQPTEELDSTEGNLRLHGKGTHEPQKI